MHISWRLQEKHANFRYLLPTDEYQLERRVHEISHRQAMIKYTYESHFEMSLK